jgi:nitroreductase
MDRKNHAPRIPETDVDSMFYERWSPRSFTREPISEKQLSALFEAARWAPSCFNEQPWLFIYTATEEDHAAFLSTLVEQNRVWAVNAPVLVFAASRNCFSKTGNENSHAAFDTGAAWASLAFQAGKSGLYAHAMAGFNREKAYDILGLPRDKYTIHAAIAVGRKGSPEDLPVEIAEREFPNTRKPLSSIVCASKFTET